MTCTIPSRLFNVLITVKKPVQSFVSGTKRPVFEYQVVQTGVGAFFGFSRTALNRNVLGQVPVKGFPVFTQIEDIEENDVIEREDNGKEYIVKESKNILGHHLELAVEERK